MPALWNHYPLLEYDTGGYLARWYEGYLVPSRSTVFGLYLHVGEHFSFWPELIAQAAVTAWVIGLTLRIFDLIDGQWRRMAIVVGALSVITSLPWLASLLLTDIFAGVAVLSLHLLLVHSDRLRPWEGRFLLFLVAFSAATHEATMAVLVALLAAHAVMAFLRRTPFWPHVRGTAAIALGASMLLAANFALARQLAWAPGGYGIAFGRMLQDGIVSRYLADHCPDARLKLCPYRTTLPPTADEFLWGDSAFDRLGRFTGLEDEMRTIVLESLVEYPLLQIQAAIGSTAKQLVMIGSGYGVNDQLPHTYGIIERYIPSQVPAMRAAHQQQGELNFTAINALHVPIALISMVFAAAIIVRALAFGGLDDVALLAASAMLAILANAFICGVLSGPHDRYGARIVWLASFAVAIAFMRYRSQRASQLPR